MTKSTPRGRRGRKPAGRGGETVGRYQHQFSARIPGDLYHLLAATNAILGRTHWQILEDALQLYLRQLPATERNVVISSAKKRRAACDQCQSDPS